MTTPYIDPDSVHTPATGTAPPASWGATVRNNLETLARAPGCSIATGSGGFTAVSNTWVDIPYAGSDLRDTDGFHSPTVNSDRITIPPDLGGWYAFAGQATIAGNASGSRQLQLRINGSSTRPLAYIPLTGSTVAAVLPISEMVLLDAGDYVQVQLRNTASVSLAGSSLMAMWMVAWP